MANDRRNDEGIDYQAEGVTPPHEKDDPTNDGYDEAVHSGPSRYGIPEGSGGVFGTTGGGSYEGGMHIEDRPTTYEGGGDDSGKTAGNRGVSKRTPGTGSE